ncbi:MAG: hypothetical protein HY021_03390, partial [Burkholderiales bacterium]|nr:hypothetical protein [Burkholderiales bacterium]
MSALPPRLAACLWRCASLLLAGALTAGGALAATDPTLAKYENASRTQPVAVAAQLGRWAAGLSETDARRIQALALQGALLAGRDDAEGAERAQREIEQLGARDPAAASAAGLVRAALAKRRGPLRQADRVVTEALGLWPADGPDWLRQRLMKLQADIKEETGKLDEAVRIRQACITLADRIGPAWRRVEERSNLALTLLLAHQIEPARHINDEALALPETQQDELAHSRALMAHAFALGDSGDAAGELKAMTAAIEAARRSGSREEEVRGLANLADHYLKRGDYPTTLAISQQALPLARELSDQSAQSVALANTALALISMHRRAEGLDTMRQALAIHER